MRSSLIEELDQCSTWRVNFLVNLGQGDAAGKHPRGPRLDFDAVAKIV